MTSMPSSRSAGVTGGSAERRLDALEADVRQVKRMLLDLGDRLNLLHAKLNGLDKELIVAGQRNGWPRLLSPVKDDEIPF